MARKSGQLFAEKASSMGIQLLLQLNPKVPFVNFDPTGISRMLGISFAIIIYNPVFINCLISFFCS